MTTAVLPLAILKIISISICGGWSEHLSTHMTPILANTGIPGIAILFLVPWIAAPFLAIANLVFILTREGLQLVHCFILALCALGAFWTLGHSDNKNWFTDLTMCAPLVIVVQFFWLWATRPKKRQNGAKADSSS